VKYESKKNKSNRLMQSMIVVSLAFHMILFFHISGIYRSNALSYIELTMYDVTKPVGRSIPRPRVRNRLPDVKKVKTLNIKPYRIPQIKIETVVNPSIDGLMETINTADLAGTVGLSLSGINTEFTTNNDYFDMVRIKIDSRKKYPESAKSKHIEGKVKVGFVITPDGQASSIRIVKNARINSLNVAALNAVKDAAPFPRPPASFLKRPLNIEITIVFELM
jgi:periplasmic protein TonB